MRREDRSRIRHARANHDLCGHGEKARSASAGVLRSSAVARAIVNDTLHPHLITGRTKHDSVAFASTVAFGRRQLAKWPAPPDAASRLDPARPSASWRSTAIRSRSAWACSANIPPSRCSPSSTTIVREWQTRRSDDAGAAGAASHRRRRAGQRRARTACIARAWTRR